MLGLAFPLIIMGVILVLVFFGIVRIVQRSPYEQGQLAFEDGMKLTDNPYRYNDTDEKMIEWEKGFNS